MRRWSVVLILAAGVGPAEADWVAGALVWSLPEDGQGALTMEGRILPAHFGRCSTFGGPADTSLGEGARVALPCGPDGEHLLACELDPEDLYCAMRWEYEQGDAATRWDGKRWWANRRILVRNPRDGRAVVVRAVDWGPNEMTGRAIDLSPGAARALGVRTDDWVVVQFAPGDAALGLVDAAVRSSDGGSAAIGSPAAEDRSTGEPPYEFTPDYIDP